ncbi:MAG: glycosyltransferase family 2 protein [Caldilineaceae bacterium]
MPNKSVPASQAAASAPERPSPPGGTDTHVVIVNWNLSDDTLACVDSLLQEGFAPDAVWVVDNGSSDNSPARLEAGLPAGVHLLQNPTNLGFAGGNNLGIRAALGAGAEWVFLLNNDTCLRAGLKVRLAEAANEAPNVRLWSPLVVYADDPRRIWSAGDRRVRGTLITLGLWRNRSLPVGAPAVARVEFLTACALIVHAEVFRAIGLLDERYFMYAEDADFCERARRAGFELACATQAVVLHKVSRSTGVQSAVARTWRTGNMARFYRDHARGLQRPLMFAFSLVRSTILATRDLVSGRRGLARASWEGWSAGWFGNPDAPIGRPPLPSDRARILPPSL